MGARGEPASEVPPACGGLVSAWPFDLLDLDLDGEALSAAIQVRVETCFT